MASPMTGLVIEAVPLTSITPVKEPRASTTTPREWPIPGPAGTRPPPARRSATRQAADERNFFAALFDFTFTSFITTKIIKVLYVLVMIMIGLSALLFTFDAFKLNATFGLLTLVIGDPLFIIVVLALWRLYLEFYIVVFRIAEDIRALRERSAIG